MYSMTPTLPQLISPTLAELGLVGHGGRTHTVAAAQPRPPSWVSTPGIGTGRPPRTDAWTNTPHRTPNAQLAVSDRLPFARVKRICTCTWTCPCRSKDDCFPWPPSDTAILGHLLLSVIDLKSRLGRTKTNGSLSLQCPDRHEKRKINSRLSWGSAALPSSNGTQKPVSRVCQDWSESRLPSRDRAP